MENLDKENKYIKAKDKVERIKKFYNNLLSYVIFISFLAALNYYTDGWRYPWFLWAAFGWVIGIFFHALKAFDWNPFFGKDWEQSKIDEYMNQDKNKYSKNQRWE